MTFVHAYCRNGDEHIGHMSEWGSGWAVIGGTRIEGVAYMDAMSGSGGRGPAPQEGSHPRTGSRSAAASSLSAPQRRPDHPVEAVRSLNGASSPSQGRRSTTGQGEPGGGETHASVATPSRGRWTCACSHTRVAHTEYGVCAMPGCRCDRFKRPVNDDAASPVRPAAS